MKTSRVNAIVEIVHSTMGNMTRIANFIGPNLQE